MKNNLFKRKEHVNVYDILTYQCEKALEAATLLLALMQTKDHALGDKIEEIEDEADEKRAQLIDYVENTYITALDRRDLYALSRKLDDITDEITDLKDFLIYFDYAPGKNSVKSINLAMDSLTNITTAMENWNKESTETFLAKLKVCERNETKSNRLFWEMIDQIKEDTSVKDILIEKEFYRNLISLAATISKASDRMGDLRIKSIK